MSLPFRKSKYVKIKKSFFGYQRRISYNQNQINIFGNPAVIAYHALDPQLCVLAFQQVCYYRYVDNIFNYYISKNIIPILVMFSNSFFKLIKYSNNNFRQLNNKTLLLLQMIINHLINSQNYYQQNLFHCIKHF